MSELFYVLDLGEYLGQGVFRRFFTENLALAIGHIASWVVNSAFWLGFLAVASRVV